jgi:hypothetical protein
MRARAFVKKNRRARADSARLGIENPQMKKEMTETKSASGETTAAESMRGTLKKKILKAEI